MTSGEITSVQEEPLHCASEMKPAPTKCQNLQSPMKLTQIWLQRRKTALLEGCPLPFEKQVRCELYAQYQVAILLYFCTEISLF